MRAAWGGIQKKGKGGGGKRREISFSLGGKERVEKSRLPSKSRLGSSFRSTIEKRGEGSDNKRRG